MAISANGIIATKEGSEDFLSHDNWNQFVKLANKIGCIIWGRKTYDEVSQWEGDYLKDLKSVKKVIISRSQVKLLDGFTLAKSPEDSLIQLEADGFKQVILTGGSEINSEYAKRGLIDEVIFDVNPALLGNGIPVFSNKNFFLELELVSSERVGIHIVELHYSVKHLKK